MEALWFCVITAMLALYAVLDGFDLGAGLLHLFLVRNERERRTLMAAGGAFWDGNEMWLLLAGGALYCAFPALFSSRIFYVSAIVLVWLLILRGISAEVRHRRWRKLLDTIFGLAGVALTFALGVSVGLLVAAVPTPDKPAGFPWLPLLCGICAFSVLTLQSATWMALKSEGDLQARCRRLANRVWWVVVASYVAVTAVAFTTQPHLAETLLSHSWIAIFAVLALAGLMAARMCLTVSFDLGAFAGACCIIVGLLASVAAGQYPYLLNQTVYDAATPHPVMYTGAIFWIPAFLLAAGYNLSKRYAVFPARLGESTIRPTTARRHA